MIATFLGDLLLSCALAAGGIYLLTHVTKLARAMQGVYVRQAEQKQKKGSWDSFMDMYDPKYWQQPFAWFLFRALVIFFGIWLLIVATVPIGSFFSPIHPFGKTIYIGQPYGG